MDSKRYFEQVAGQWDKMRRTFFSDSVREIALATAGVQREKTAADIGAGSGFITLGLLQMGLRVIAVDQSPAMLEEMKKKFHGYADLDCRIGEAEHLPIGDGTVDYVFANMFLHHVEFPGPAIKEMVRILKPGGKLVITDLDEHEYTFLRDEQHDRWLGFKRGEIERWFREAGLHQVKIDCVGEECCSESACGCGSASISIFVASGVK